MARLARLVIPGLPHHVVNRGNDRMAVFRDEEDRKRFVALLSESLVRAGCEIWSYCLMGNHFHFVGVPEKSDSFARLMRLVQADYARRFNSRHTRVNHLWGSRFYSAPLDGRRLWAAVRYVERNPVRAGLVTEPTAYPWSSAAGNAGEREDRLLAEDRPLPGAVRNWRAWLAEEDCEGVLDEVRRATRTGRPCGSAEFVREIEKRTGRSLQRRKPGPKPASDSGDRI